MLFANIKFSGIFPALQWCYLDPKYNYFTNIKQSDQYYHFDIGVEIIAVTTLQNNFGVTQITSEKLLSCFSYALLTDGLLTLTNS